eukprot:7381182-Prymnesium_polylepis.1
MMSGLLAPFMRSADASHTLHECGEKSAARSHPSTATRTAMMSAESRLSGFPILAVARPAELDVTHPLGCVGWSVVEGHDDRLGAVARTVLIALGPLWRQSRRVPFRHAQQLLACRVRDRLLADDVRGRRAREPVVVVGVARKLGRLSLARPDYQIDDHPRCDDEARPDAQRPLDAQQHLLACDGGADGLLDYRWRDRLDLLLAEPFDAEPSHRPFDEPAQRLAHACGGWQLHLALPEDAREREIVLMDAHGLGYFVALRSRLRQLRPEEEEAGQLELLSLRELAHPLGPQVGVKLAQLGEVLELAQRKRVLRGCPWVDAISFRLGDCHRHLLQLLERG